MKTDGGILVKSTGPPLWRGKTPFYAVLPSSFLLVCAGLGSDPLLLQESPLNTLPSLTS